MMVSLVASIPSPSQNQISLGPIDLRAYGFLIALGVLAGVWLASRRIAKDGLDPEVIPNMALWVLPAAIIGARLYFVLTNWGRFSGDIASAFRIWEGGLGIPGGVALGAVVGVWWLRRQDVPLPPVFTAVALGLPLGQIIGRFGNWFNQELYGRPTDLPWGLEIDEAHRLAGYEDEALFHPTFAYEIIWNIGLLAVLLKIDRSRRLRSGALFAVYLIGYGIGRILIETVRIDPVNDFLGIRLHIWAMVAFIIAALVYLRRYGLADADDGIDDAEAKPTKPQAPLARPKRSSKGTERGAKAGRRAKAGAKAAAGKASTKTRDRTKAGVGATGSTALADADTSDDADSDISIIDGSDDADSDISIIDTSDDASAGGESSASEVGDGEPDTVDSVDDGPVATAKRKAEEAKERAARAKARAEEARRRVDSSDDDGDDNADDDADKSRRRAADAGITMKDLDD